MLLDKYHELENQEIYFAAPAELNDPIEGFKDIYWHGDEIAWLNLVKHYLLCLEHVCSLLVIGGNTISIQPDNIPVFMTPDQLPTVQYKNLVQEIWSDIFNNDLIRQCIKDLSERSSHVRRSELISYFSGIHLYALEKIFASYERHKLANKRADTEEIHRNAMRTLSQLPLLIKHANELEEAHPELERATDVLYSAMLHTTSQLGLIARYNGPAPVDDNRSFVLLSYPEAFVRRIEAILYPDWYAACFMNQYSNSSVWGNYADKHRGVCLSFKTTTSDPPPAGAGGILVYNVRCSCPLSSFSWCST